MHVSHLLIFWFFCFAGKEARGVHIENKGVSHAFIASLLHRQTASATCRTWYIFLLLSIASIPYPACHDVCILVLRFGIATGQRETHQCIRRIIVHFPYSDLVVVLITVFPQPSSRPPSGHPYSLLQTTLTSLSAQPFQPLLGFLPTYSHRPSPLLFRIYGTSWRDRKRKEEKERKS